MAKKRTSCGPFSGIVGTERYTFLDDDDFDFLKNNKEFQKLRKECKVKIEGNELWFDGSTRTKNMLKKIF